MTRIAHTVLESRSGYANTIRTGHHVLLADEPTTAGGSDSGPAPYQLLLASLAACTAITLRMYAERKKWSLGTIHVDVELHKDAPQNVDRITRVLSFSEALSPEQRQRLLEISAKTPVTKTLMTGTPIETSVLGG